MSNGIFNSEQVDKYNKLVKLCNDNGHLKPDEKNNICNHCYRDLKVEIPRDEELESVLEERSNLPIMKTPYDAPALVRRTDSNAKLAEDLNYFTGLIRHKEYLENR